MAKITTITNPLTGQPAQVDQLDHTAQQIDDGLNIARGVSNPNLLDNWYFGNPVNQRGQTEYGGGNYSIDRWTVSSTNTGAKIAVASDGIILTATTDKPAQFIQGLEIPLSKSLVGKKVTLSALVSEVSGGVGISLARSKTAMYNENGVGSGSPIVSKSGIVTITVTIPDVLTKNQFFNATLTCRAGSSGKIVAMKLELGSHQTLAHQENGVWVLNEIPDYGEQLARCQRHFQLYSSADLRPAKAVDCRPTMRADPSQSTIVVNSTTYYYNTADL